MPDCAYQPTGKRDAQGRNEYRCPACGHIRWHEYPPQYLHHPCTNAPLPMPSVIERAWSLAKAVTGFVADGCATVDDAEYRRRLSICDVCEHRVNATCGLCGCYIDWKAKGRAFDCPDKPSRWSKPLPIVEVQILNLLYHVSAFTHNDTWRRNVRQLLHRMSIFNGKRVIGIVVDPELESPETVQEAFAGHGCEFVIREHEPRLREAATFLPLIQAVASTDARDATFYAHTKGVTRPGHKGVEYHRNMMYHELLDDPGRVRRLLSQYAMVGTTRFRHQEGNPFWGVRLAEAHWHFSGTFWWFRNRDWFGNPRWYDIVRTHQHGWVVEALPGLMFPYEACHCVAYDNPRDVYGAETYADNPISDEDPLP